MPACCELLVRSMSTKPCTALNSMKCIHKQAQQCVELHVAYYAGSYVHSVSHSLKRRLKQHENCCVDTAVLLPVTAQTKVYDGVVCTVITITTQKVISVAVCCCGCLIHTIAVRTAATVTVQLL
jgi:hypothetical protein